MGTALLPKSTISDYYTRVVNMMKTFLIYYTRVVFLKKMSVLNGFISKEQHACSKFEIKILCRHYPQALCIVVTVCMDVYIRDIATPAFLTMMYYTRVVNNQYVYIQHHSFVPYVV